jgi:hypothetical protein
MPPLRDLAPVVETLTLVTQRGVIESRIYHDHYARVLAAQAAQRIARVDANAGEWRRPLGLRTVVRKQVTA